MLINNIFVHTISKSDLRSPMPTPIHRIRTSSLLNKLHHIGVRTKWQHYNKFLTNTPINAFDSIASKAYATFYGVGKDMGRGGCEGLDPDHRLKRASWGRV
ncbi:hypothetical protein L6452_15266 [Arctium lappa]|uniref:Uncharacterized protein n=1 Tax=Arctium lappa TaxID=4217 RepID=A0ACB9CNA1_ARCLA|nr:hypothetical protein L6452_15266 [Arctium lappa]